MITWNTHPSNPRLELKKLHRSREQSQDVLPPQDPGVHQIGPLLHHMPALMLVLRLIVDTPRGPSVFVR